MMMQRYDLEKKMFSADIVPSKDGEWVRYEDVGKHLSAEIKNLELREDDLIILRFQTKLTGEAMKRIKDNLAGVFENRVIILEEGAELLLLRCECAGGPGE